MRTFPNLFVLQSRGDLMFRPLSEQHRLPELAPAGCHALRSTCLHCSSTAMPELAPAGCHALRSTCLHCSSTAMPELAPAGCHALRSTCLHCSSTAMPLAPVRRTARAGPSHKQPMTIIFKPQ
jgi:hypothetical protein